MLQCTGRLHTVLAYMLFVSVYCTVYNILYFPIAVDVGGIPDLLISVGMVEFFLCTFHKTNVTLVGILDGLMLCE